MQKKIGNKKLGIWGTGAVGQAAIISLQDKLSLSVMSNGDLPTSISDLNLPFYPQAEHEQFFADNDLILASPGIDLRPFPGCHHKLISELDLLSQFCSIPTIGITGTVGKTTITYSLAELLKKEMGVFMGGNIGTGLLEEVNQQNDMNVLELSSFQLEHTKAFAPDLAIITNIFENHLDRHASFDDYRNAKLNLLRQQTAHQQALIPLELMPLIKKINYRGTVAAISLMKPESLHPFPIYHEHNRMIYRTLNGKTNVVCENVPPSGFIHNWLFIIGALDLLGKKLHSLEIPPSSYLEHRLEYVGSHKGIAFYNDSKSTIMESTLAAVNELKNKPILLLLGGLSKGVNREPYFLSLREHCKRLICFGAEAEALHRYAQTIGIQSCSTNSLDEAFAEALKDAGADDQILLSPGGSSFDLFQNYKERGKAFKNLLRLKK